MIIESKKIENALKQLNSFTSDTMSIPALTGIHVLYKKGESVLRLEACDSYVANIIDIHIDTIQDCDDDVDMIIEPMKFKTKAEYVYINFKDMYISYENNKRISINEIYEDSYPSLDRCIPNDEADMKISFTVKNLKKVLKGLNSDDVVTFMINNPVKAVRLTTRNNNDDFNNNSIIISPCKRY